MLKFFMRFDTPLTVSLVFTLSSLENIPSHSSNVVELLIPGKAPAHGFGETSIVVEERVCIKISYEERGRYILEYCVVDPGVLSRNGCALSSVAMNKIMNVIVRFIVVCFQSELSLMY